jgi:hypothetical protein
VGVWDSTALAGQRSMAGGSEITQHAEPLLHGPMWLGLACSACYSFSIWWLGELFHEVGVQSADIPALPDALPQSCVSPASYQSPWITGVRRFLAVFWSPSWI